MKPDPILGTPADKIFLGEEPAEEPSLPQQNEELEFRLERQPVEQKVPDPFQETESPSVLKQRQDLLEENPQGIQEESVPFGEVIETEEPEPSLSNSFEAPAEEIVPVEGSGVEPAPLIIPPIREPQPVEKLFEETAVPPLDQVELLTRPGLEPLPEKEIQELETLKVTPETSPFEDFSSDSGPLLEFNSSSLRDELEIKVVSREKSQVGSGTLFEVYLLNRSTEVFRDLTLKATFSPALFVPGKENEELARSVPRIDPGEELKVPLTLFSEEEGYHCVRFSLQNANREELRWHSTCVTYISETLRTDLLGPDEISVNSHGQYTLFVQNVSRNPLNDVEVKVRYDSVLNFLDSSQPVTSEDQELVLKIPSLKGGESIPVSYAFEGIKESSNSSLTVQATAGGIPPTETGAYLSIKHPQGALDLDLEQAVAPLEVGEETDWVIVCRNQGLATLRGSQLSIQLPDTVQLVRSGWGARRSEDESQNSGSNNNQLQLKTPDIPPGISARYTLHVKGVATGSKDLWINYENPETTPTRLERRFPMPVVQQPKPY
ncbi:MAG: hypothetical protein R3C11_04430 [Planctomycetaceae bacterium]